MLLCGEAKVRSPEAAAVVQAGGDGRLSLGGGTRRE